ncbi:MAG: phage tail tape measure protein [Ruminococcus sp.]|nr:phage tail tape measure protein [Ruminococcus sp.]
MASKIKGITIQIGADTLGLDKALKDVEKKSKDAAAEIKEVEKAVRITGDSTELWTQKQKLLETALDGAKDKLKMLEDAQEDVNKQLQNKQITGEQYRAFQRELEYARSAVGHYSDELEKANKKLEELNGETKDASDNSDDLGDGLENVGKKSENAGDGASKLKDKLKDLAKTGFELVIDGAKKAGGTLFQFTEDAVKTGAEFEAAMSTVGAISGATAEEMELLNEKAQEMGATTKFTAAESAEAFQYMAMAGWDAQEMLDGIGGVLSLAAASGTELSTTSDIVTDALTALKMSAEDTAHFVDVMAAAASNSNTNVEMLGESFQYAAPIVGTMGGSIEDLSLALGIMANSGIKGSQSGNSLKNALVNLVKPTKQQTEAMKSLGLITTETQRVFDNDAIEKAQEKAENKTRALEKAQISYNQAVEKYGEDSANAQRAAINLEQAESNLSKANEELAKAQEGTVKEIATGGSAFTDAYGNMKPLKEILDVLRETMGGVNIELTDSEGNLREYDDIIAELEQSEEGLTQAEQLRNAGIIFGKQNLSGMLAIINASEEDYNSLADAIYNCDGAAGDMSSTMIDNLQGDMTLLGSAVDGMKISLSDSLNPAIRDVVQYVTKKIPDVQRILKPVFDRAGKFITTTIEKLPAIWKTIRESTAFGILEEAISNTINVGGKLIGTLEYIPVVGSLINDFKIDLQINEATQQARELADNIQADADKMDELQRTADEQVKTDFADIYVTERFYDELQKLVDENGKVKSGYEDRAAYIANELSQATGLEIQLIDGQISKYRELQDEIENTIAKQKAQVFQGAYSEAYAEALLQNEKSGKEYGELQDIISENEEIIQNFKVKFKNEFDEDEYEKFISDYGELSEKNLDKWKEQGVFYDGEYEKLKVAYENILNAKSSTRQLKAQVEENNWIIQQYEKAEEEFYAGRYSLAQSYYASIDDFDRSRVDNSEKNNAELLEDFRKQTNNAIKEYKNNVGAGLKDTEKSAHESVMRAVEDMKKQGLTGADMLKTGIIDKLSEIDGFDAHKLVDFCNELGVSLGEALGSMTAENAGRYISQMTNDFDMVINTLSDFHVPTDALERARNILGGMDFYADGGFIRSGQGIVAEAGPELIEIVSGGAKITPLTHTARNIPMFAKGGFLGSGRGIIGEAGPELVRIMNGGAEITPIKNLKNSKSEASGNTVINNYYEYTTNANIAGTYDVYRLNEELDTARRRMDSGIGVYE